MEQAVRPCALARRADGPAAANDRTYTAATPAVLRDPHTVEETVEKIDGLLATIMHGRALAAAIDCPGLFERACFHGVAPIVHERLNAAGLSAAPGASRFRQEAMASAMWELRHRTLLTGLVAALNERGVEPVCFKGTALAYGLYEQPHHRSRGDTDLIVPPHALPAARSAFQSSGFQRQNSLPGDSVHAQETWCWRGHDGAVHAIDLHWRINNARALGDLFSYDELRATAFRLPDLGHLAAADRVRSLVIAAFHRAVHQFDRQSSCTGIGHSGERLCWLYDIHLLARRLTGDAWSETFSLARAKGVEATLIQSLRLAQARFATQVPDHLMSAPVEWGAADRYLQRTPLQRELMEVFGWGVMRAARHLGDVMFPPAEYLHRRYAAAHLAWLPWLHLRRWTKGIVKRFALSRAGT